MMGNQTLCALYVATAGLQGNALGSDEEEIVLLIYTIIDITRNKVIAVQQYVVKPSSADVNDNLLSDQLVQESFVTEEMVKTAGVSLETAIKQFDEFIRLLQIDPDSPLFKFITDGQLPLRQCLHPEACTKNITLPDYYCSFYDLRKHFRHFYNVPEEQEFKSVKDLVDYLGMPHELNSDLYISCVQDMVNIILRLIADGHSFSEPETIQIKLEPGICSKDEEVDNNCVVRARGLPWQSSDQDIAKFFRGLNIIKGGVALCLSAQGRRNGEALVRFESQEHRDLALKRHKHHISDRYIEVYMATGTDFVMVAGGCNNEAQAFLKKGAQVIIRMRGLPYDCTAEEVLEFFDRGENRCTVMDGVDGVLFVKKPDGRATGDAFVLFAEDEVAPKALSKHRELIGSRYIELFRSTTAEVQQVLNRSMDPKTFEVTPAPLALPALPQPMPLLPQHVITSGTRKDCIRLRGLPYEAQVENILEFLGDHAKNIVFQGVHMVYNAQGQPSGEAFIQMDSESSAFITAQQKHHRYMFYGKKQRYIEVFQCSGDDMSMVLTGNYPTTAAVSAVSPVAKTLLSPGMSLPPATNPLAAAAAETSPTAGAVPSAAAAEAAYDLAVLQQTQIAKQHQDIWFMNHLAAAQQQQQQQNVAHNAVVAQQHAAALYQQQQQQQQQQQMLALATASFVAKNGAAVPQPRAVWPPELAASVPLTSALLAQNNHKLAAYPSIFPPHLPPPHPMFYINIPPPQPPAAAAAAAAAAAKLPQYTYQQFVPPYVAAAMPPPPTLNLKRSWDQAFPGSATDANANLVKRQYGATAATNVSSSMTAPVPQNHPTYSMAGYPSAPAFYAPM